MHFHVHFRAQELRAKNDNCKDNGLFVAWLTFILVSKLLGLHQMKKHSFQEPWSLIVGEPNVRTVPLGPRVHTFFWVDAVCNPSLPHWKQ